ncbi:MAG: diacylglycerol kinase family lipid kinase [Rhodothermia bacterium]|nr:MAG: diacylglycerol kinase family lipid kinase [Rhodothermia bacterium]
MKVTAIINPASRVGQTSTRADGIATALLGAGFEVKVVLSERPLHALDLAREAGADGHAVLAVGGDGTVNEVARGILESGSKAVLGVLPMGTGNDFARMIGMSENLTTAVRQLKTCEHLKVDIGRVRWKDQGEALSTLFVNAIGIGFDAHAANIAPRYKGYPFQLGYLAAILVALSSWKSQAVTVSDLDDTSSHGFRGRLFFVTVGNARDSGGGYTINPNASIVDGLLDVCLVRSVHKLRALRMLPSVRTGSHLDYQEVQYWHSTGIRIESEQGLPIHTDGEVQSLNATDIKIEVDSKALYVMVPKDRIDDI